METLVLLKIITTSQCRIHYSYSEKHKGSVIMFIDERNSITIHLNFRKKMNKKKYLKIINKRIRIHYESKVKESNTLIYSQLWKGRFWGVWFPCDPSDPMRNIPWQCTLLPLPFETRTESIGSKVLSPCRLGPKGCTREAELGCITWLKLCPDDCDWGDDRRERAQSESWTRAVNLSQYIFLLAPSLSEAMVLRSGWQTGASRDNWLLSGVLLFCKNEICFPPPI